MKNAFSDPEVVFNSNDEKEDKLHDRQVSLESIYAWKRHLLRAVHQDRARQEVLLCPGVLPLADDVSRHRLTPEKLAYRGVYLPFRHCC